MIQRIRRFYRRSETGCSPRSNKILGVVKGYELIDFCLWQCGKIKMVPNVGFELTTYRLQGGCSTTELIRHYMVSISELHRTKGISYGRFCPHVLSIRSGRSPFEFHLSNLIWKMVKTQTEIIQQVFLL